MCAPTQLRTFFAVVWIALATLSIVTAPEQLMGADESERPALGSRIQ